MQEAFIPYKDGEIQLEGFAAYPSFTKSPAVILCHAFKGRDEFICEKAKLLANWGYVGFALDMYGKGVLGKTLEESLSLKKPFVEDRRFLQTRILKAFDTVCHLPYVDPDHIAVIGFGFGGLCALDLMRSGANLVGAISVYGHFSPPSQELIKPSKAKVLILHGYEDPITPQNELLAFEKELNDANIDWQAHVYGGTQHAFATPGVNSPASGLLYHPIAAKRAWLAIHNFLHEIFTNNPS